MSREAMQMALEALESDPISHSGLVNRKQAITILRQALETEQEPVLWLKRELLERCETEMRYAGWTKYESDNPARHEVYEEVKEFLARSEK